MIKKVVMPAAGQTTDVATVTKIKVKPGDQVKKGDVLLEVETDKAVLPIESFAKGFVTQVLVNEFDKVDAGTELLYIGDEKDLEAAKSGASAAPAAAPAAAADADEDDFAPIVKAAKPAEEKQPAAAPAEVKTAAVAAPEGVKAMPNAKKLASELGIRLEDVKPSNGIFVKAADVEAAANAAKAAAQPAAVAAEENYIPTARIRKTLAGRWEEAAKVPVFSISVSADTSAIDAVCGEKYSRGYFVMLALARLARKYPVLRVRFEKGVQKLSDTCDAALAIFAENGTVSAVVKAADNGGIAAIAAACSENAEAIGRGDLSCVCGSAFTVYDMSKYVIDSFTAPVNAPETAAFGVTGGAKLTVTGSFDIRVIEGNIAAAIMSELRDCLENPALMLI